MERVSVNLARPATIALDEYQSSLVPIIDEAVSQLDDHTK